LGYGIIAITLHRVYLRTWSLLLAVALSSWVKNGMFIDVIGVAKLVAKCNTAIISAVDSEGFPHTEALLLRKR